MIVPFILSIAINLPQVHNTFIEDRHHVIDPWSTTACRPDLRRRPSTSPLSPSPSPSSSFICLWPSQAGYKPIQVVFHHFTFFLNPSHPTSSSLVSLSNVHGKPYGIFDAMALSFQDSNTIGDFKAEIVLHVYLSWNIESP